MTNGEITSNGRRGGMTYQISGRDAKGREFTAGLVTSVGRVMRTAPILKYMRGWDMVRVREHCQVKGWSLATAGVVDVE